MEKKTIGKFIAALRKANGMTQRELGEKLYVSDKTVSRWERDECTPELSLIPALAEIFGITTDELLRGERDNPERDLPYPEEASARQRAKSDRQFKLMLDKNKRKFQNLTFISIGITVLGFIAAMAVNLGLSKGLFAFCIACALCLVSEICELIFAANARIARDEDDGAYADLIGHANLGTAKTAVGVTFGNLSLVAFCLPLVTVIDGANFGMVFDAWLIRGAVFALIALLVGYILYVLFIQKALAKHGWLKETAGYKRRLLAKCLLISGSVFLVIVLAFNITNSILGRPKLVTIEFNDWEDFKIFVEGDYDEWYQNTYGSSHSAPVPIGPDGELEEEPYYPQKIYEDYINKFGERLFSYYYNPNLYESVEFYETKDGQIEEITVQYYDDHTGIQLAVPLLVLLTTLDVLITAAVYLIKLRKYNNAL